MINFLYGQNKDTESKIIDSANILVILEILEGGSMNEFVRESLSEKKKIKDLFLVVIKSIDINENMKLISSLI